MNSFMLLLLRVFITIILRSRVFSTIEERVIEWSTTQLTGTEKRNGVMGEIQGILPNITETIIRIGIEMAVLKLKDYQVEIPIQTSGE